VAEAVEIDPNHHFGSDIFGKRHNIGKNHWPMARKRQSLLPAVPMAPAPVAEVVVSRPGLKEPGTRVEDIKGLMDWLFYFSH